MIYIFEERPEVTRSGRITYITSVLAWEQPNPILEMEEMEEQVPFLRRWDWSHDLLLCGRFNILPEQAISASRILACWVPLDYWKRRVKEVRNSVYRF